MSRPEAVHHFLASLSGDDAKRLVVKLTATYRYPVDELQRIFTQNRTSVRIPSYAFVHELGMLESIVKYLHEELGYRYSKIALLLHRDPRTIWTTYQRAAKKFPGRFPVRRSEFSIPLSIYDNRRLGVLEATVRYMKDELLYRFQKIARSLGRDARTIWTSYHNAKVKEHAYK